MTEVAVRVEDLSKRFRLYHERNQSLKAAVMRRGRAAYEEFWALRDINLEVAAGSTFGLVGENGSGKSTLLKCIARILRPDRGRVVTHGKVAALLELGSGFHPELSGRENIYLNGSILGLSRRELAARYDDIVGFAGLERFIDTPVKNYSSGMYVRLGFSVAINVDPDILLVDEVLAVGDAAFQRKCQEKFADFRRQGKTVIIVSHDSGAMQTMCDEVAWLDGGRLNAIGRPADVVGEYVDEGLEERADKTEDELGQARWGSGEARLEKVELLDAAGRPTTRFRTGDRVTVRQHYRASERIPRPVFGLGIDHIDGAVVWAHHSRHGDYVPDSIDGHGYVDLVIPRLMLQPGTYELIASIVDFALLHQYDFVKPFLRFDVEHGSVHESGGFASLSGTWGNLTEEREPVDAVTEPIDG